MQLQDLVGKTVESVESDDVDVWDQKEPRTIFLNFTDGSKAYITIAHYSGQGEASVSVLELCD